MPKKTKFSRTDVRGHTDAIEEQGRAARGGGFGGRSRHIFHNRVIVLLGVFCFIVILYTVNLIALQAAGNAYSVFDPVTTPVAASTKTVTLQAPRGEIYDRSGNKLVTNSTSYTVFLDYTSFFALGGVEQRNQALLDLLSTLSTPAEGELQPCLSEEFFPFEGEYPNLRLSAAANDPSSRVYSELKKTLSFLGTPDISSQKIVQYTFLFISLMPAWTVSPCTAMQKFYPCSDCIIIWIAVLFLRSIPTFWQKISASLS